MRTTPAQDPFWMAISPFTWCIPSPAVIEMEDLGDEEQVSASGRPPTDPDIEEQ
jgi:hypothetical protein